MSDSSKPAAKRSPEDRQLAEELVERARSEGVDLVGPEGLLSGLTKNVLEPGLEAEMTEHLGYDRHDPSGKNTGNSRNGTWSKKVLTDVGPVEIEVPRDRDGGRALRRTDIALACQTLLHGSEHTRFKYPDSTRPGEHQSGETGKAQRSSIIQGPSPTSLPSTSRCSRRRQCGWSNGRIRLNT